ncbi:YihY/virulence factor BrkB family protein [Jannaschia sp. 2305UL9-9]|uniref:YihY/virulence factor BrkB family protein n=1 Tax=Jannaschia sp. 2305UL9-9 TaxID=3121638 RepID=UPI0035291AFC
MSTTSHRPHRGHLADTPTEVPPRGWKDIARRVVAETSDDRVLLVAAGVTFYLLLALAPTLAAFVSLYGLFFDTGSIQEHMAVLQGIVPDGGMTILQDQIDRLVSTDQGTLGFAFVLSLAVALWSATSGMKSLFEAMNVAYDENEKRGFVGLTLQAFAMTVVTMAGAIALITTDIVLSAVLGASGGVIATIVTAALGLLALVLFMAALYRYGPSREAPEWAWITPGAILAAICIVLVSVAFSFYVSNFGTYNETYGSLGAVVGFLTWLWLTLTVLILGAELNSEMEHQTARDTTTGQDEPMGQRGAVMADKVARPSTDAH